MPLFYQQHINQYTKLAIWKIEEIESFFAETIPLQREITHPHKRLQHLAGRYLLRFLFPDFPYDEILIADTRKPFLPNEEYHFSISHCGDYAAAIVSKTERVGIDIEIATEKVVKIAHKFTNDKEINQLQKLNCGLWDTNHSNWDTNHSNWKSENTKPASILTLLWCCKETMFKWYSLGNVDFKKMLHIEVDKTESEGSFNTAITTQNAITNLTVNYKIFNELTLAFAYQ